MSTEERIFNLLEETKTNWTIVKKPMVSIDGDKSGSFGLYRKDLNHWFASVGNQYTPYQNHELATAVIKASEGISDDVKGGLFKKGAKVFYQVKLPDHIVETETVKRNITALNSHDGTTSIAFGSSNTVVSCQNSFYRAYKGLKKFRHTATAADQITQARKELHAAISNDEKLMEDFKRMTEHKIDQKLFGSLTERLFKVDMKASAKDVSTQKKNQLLKFSDAIEQELDHKGETLWGLFNGVTYYTNHVAPNEKQNRQEYIMTGTGGEKNLIAFKTIMSWINESAPKQFSVAE